MQDSKDDKPVPQNQTERAVHLLRHLFHTEFCVEEDVPQDKKIDVEPFYFCGWLDKHMGMMDGEAACEIAKVPYSTWDFVRAMVDKGTAPEALFQVWYSIVLSDRPDPAHKLTSINIVTNLTYADGTISTTQAFMTRDMLEGPDFNDNIVASIMRSNMRAMLVSMMKLGLDGLYEKSKENIFTSPEPEDPFDVMMGLMIKHLVPQLKPALQPAVKTYVRLAQQLIRPVLPPEVVAQLRARAEKNKGKEAGKPRGGWDA
jgi:hypothetical protein